MLTLLGILFLGFSGGVLASWYVFLRKLRPQWERKAKKDWYPYSNFGDKLFDGAEEYRKMEEQRQLHDARRSYPPRSDAGRSAKINRIAIRSIRSTR